MSLIEAKLRQYADLWSLTIQDHIISSETSVIYRAQWQAHEAVLKVFTEKGLLSESTSSTALQYFSGESCVTLYNADEGAQLTEYIDGNDLKQLAKDNATEVIANTVKGLHKENKLSLPKIPSMKDRFQSLMVYAKTQPQDSIVYKAAHIAQCLLAEQKKIVVLHGDIHHGNILQSSNRGWLAIDPKPVIGDPIYDLANAFYNPYEFFDFVSTPLEIEKKLHIFSDKFSYNPKKILQYAFAYGCLSAVWMMEDEQSPEQTFAIAETIFSLIQQY